jgi:hypothetical protein
MCGSWVESVRTGGCWLALVELGLVNSAITSILIMVIASATGLDAKRLRSYCS